MTYETHRVAKNGYLSVIKRHIRRILGSNVAKGWLATKTVDLVTPIKQCRFSGIGVTD